MEKRILLSLILMILAINSILAATTSCNPQTTLINQDPYPAIPGDYVKLVFQVNGIQDPNCGTISINLRQNFPFTIDPTEKNPIVIESGIYERNFNSFLTAPFKVRVDENAIDGENTIEVATSNNELVSLSLFNVTVEDSRSDFEIFIKDYKTTTKIMTLEVLNTGKNNVKALTIEIPKQKHIEIKGANRNIVGDLDSNEYSTADFEVASAGGDINLNLYYTDSISVRRTLNKTITFDPEYFQNRATDAKSSKTKYLIPIVILIVIGIIVYRKFKKRRIH
jgi:hypothetical protein